MSKLDFAQGHEQILQPIESLVTASYSRKFINHDHDAIRVYEALISYYKALVTNFPLPTHKLTSDGEISLYNVIVEISETYVAKDMLECMKLLKNSALLWNKNHGSQGYLDYISKFLS